MPALGFGTLIADPVATRQATKAALEVGFRHFDCAERYRNEQAVGDAMKDVFKTGAIGRKDVFVTTKLWNNNHRPERVAPAFEASRRRLQLDYLDCYLIHTPFAFQPGDEQEPKDERGQIVYDSGVTLVETWQALERLVDEGKCGAIGLSNVNLEKLREIVDAARIKPAVVEVESHPYLPEWELLDYCRQQGSCCWRSRRWGMRWSRDCSTTRRSSPSPGGSTEPLPRSRSPGRCSAVRLS
jgi:diketogulonate reductase-like aldo/keto reductase